MGSVLSSFYSSGDAQAAAVADGETQANSLVKVFHTSAAWNSNFDLHKSQPNQLMVVDFSAIWCGPCRFMEPVFKSFSTKYTDAVFVKIDVDELRDVAGKWRVEAMPTFVLFKGGQEVDRVVGAAKNDLERKIQLHLS